MESLKQRALWNYSFLTFHLISITAYGTRTRSAALGRARGASAAAGPVWLRRYGGRSFVARQRDLYAFRRLSYIDLPFIRHRLEINPRNCELVMFV
ncbi:hypothetical protein EVAR_26775_1 [Eumeta japonica]|uniref:Uncharacterized protein n=1 Tax=Eumeta variegata TaxID=151549 RepID=A0A4C1XAP9_EUMVA|nr:hypothetical protein EVAR_26775_1 [Eumeta japonica]